MAESLPAGNDTQNDIDLISVLERVASFLDKYKKYLFLAAMIGAVCGYVIYMALPNIYSSKLILHSSVLTNPEDVEIIENWSDLLKNKEYSILSENLNCSPDVLHKIDYITATEIQKNAGPGNTPSGFTIEVFVKDTAILEKFQRALIYGLENIDYVKDRIEVRRQQHEDLINKLNLEIAKLDSIKNRIETSSSQKSQGLASFIIDISNVNSQVINLNEKLHQYQEDLKFIDAIQVLQKFEKYSKPDSPKRSTLVIAGFFGGLLLAYIQIIFNILRKKIELFRKSRISGT